MQIQNLSFYYFIIILYWFVKVNGFFRGVRKEDDRGKEGALISQGGAIMHRCGRRWALGSFPTNVLEAPLSLILMALVWTCYCNCREMRFGIVGCGVISTSVSLLEVTGCNLGGWEARSATHKPRNGIAQDLRDDVFSLWDLGSNPFLRN